MKSRSQPEYISRQVAAEAQGEVVDDDDEEVSVQKPYGESPKPVLISPEAPLQPTEHKTAVESGQSPLRSTPTETAEA